MPTPNLHTLIQARDQLAKSGIAIEQLNAPSATSCTSLPLLAEYGVTHAEPGHALTGTIPANQQGDQPERIAMLWLSEISHHFRGDSYCYGGGYYRRGHAQHALVFTPENQKITETNLKTVDDSSIDYTLPLAGEFPVSSAVVLCFRTQIFVTRSDVVLLSGIHRGEPEIVGRYDSLGNSLGGVMARFVVLVIDSFGVGAMKDVTLVRPQDAGANTCGHILSQLPHLQLPMLEKMGANQCIRLCALEICSRQTPQPGGVAELQHEGGDTFMGHQEILGTRPLPPLRMPFRDVIDRVEQALLNADWQVERRGDDLQFLWVNQAVAIGDNLEADLGQVYNITANLSVISFDDAIKIGRIVREQVQVGRVITFGGLLTDSQRILDAAESKEGRFIGINAPRSGAYDNGFRVVHMGYGVDEKVQVPQKLYEVGVPTVLVGESGGYCQ